MLVAAEHLPQRAVPAAAATRPRAARNRSFARRWRVSASSTRAIRQPLALDGVDERLERGGLRVVIAAADQHAVAAGLDRQHGGLGHRVFVGREADEIGRSRKSPSDSARRHRLGQDFHRGQCYPRARIDPTLVISHNKTLAAQLYSEFKQFFPNNAVEYFVSYFDYYQPEAYIPRTDTYIEKDSSINEEIERLRLSTHERAALAPRCDRGRERLVHLRRGIAGGLSNDAADGEMGQQITREAVLGRLVDMLYERNDIEFRAWPVSRAR